MPDQMEYVLATLTDALKHHMWYGIGILVLHHLCWGKALHTIAKRRELKGRWTAWVPILNMWLLGSIADQYQYVVKGEVTFRRVGLFVYSLLEKIGLATLLVLLGFQLNVLAGAAREGTPLLGLLWIPVKYLKVSIQILVCYLIARFLLVESRTGVLYDVYRSCDPEKATVYTILSVIPFLGLFFRPLRLKEVSGDDFGMPPRREEFTDQKTPVYYGADWYEPEVWSEER